MLHKNSMGILALIILALGITLYIAPTVLPSVPTAKGASRTIYLIGYVQAWNSSQTSGPNPTITVTQGDSITIELSSGDTSHRFLLDFDADGVSDTADCSPTGTMDICSISFSTTPTSVSFTANTVGTYMYYCTIHYPAMIGTLKVLTPTPDFTVSSNPSSLPVVQGSNANSTITVSSINNFAGSIMLSATSSPSGPTTSFNATTVTVPAGGTAHSKLTISTTSGTPLNTYTITVTATSTTGTSRTRTVSVSVVSSSSDFTIVSNPTSLTVAQSSQGTTTITLTSVNSFSGTISLATSVNPNGPTASFNPSSVTLSPGGTATATLTIGTGSSGYYPSPVSLGSYTVTVTGTSGSLLHSATIALTVGNTSTSPSGVGNLPISLIIGIIVGVVAVLGVGVYLIRRKPGK